MTPQTPPEDLDYFSTADHEREERCGFPEVLFAQNKEPAHLAALVWDIFSTHNVVLATRATEEHAQAVREKFTSKASEHQGKENTAEDAQSPIPPVIYLPRSNMLFCDARDKEDGGTDAASATPHIPDLLKGGGGHVLVCCAGTSDLPVAEEAALTARLMGSNVTLINDIGVAGVHRTLSHQDLFRTARVIVCAAGMEGALPSLVAGLVDIPVIALPTSVGYGASLGGIAALLGMLNSCAGGVSVVNIDNGFGAGLIAHRINQPPQRLNVK